MTEPIEPTQPKTRRFPHVPLWALIIAAGVMLFAGVAVGQTVRADDLEQTVEASRFSLDDARELARLQLQMCNAGDDTAAEAAQLGLCGKATELVKQPAILNASGGLTEDDVRRITGELLATFPIGIDANTARGIAENVANSRPPAPGVTPQQLTAAANDAVTAYLAANPIPIPEDGQDGQDGQDGADGRDGANGQDCDPAVIPDCRGPQGPQGVSLLQGNFAVNEGGQCVFRQQLFNPDTEETVTVDALVPAQFCTPDPPPLLGGR